MLRSVALNRSRFCAIIITIIVIMMLMFSDSALIVKVPFIFIPFLLVKVSQVQASPKPPLFTNVSDLINIFTAGKKGNEQSIFQSLLF